MKLFAILAALTFGDPIGRDEGCVLKCMTTMIDTIENTCDGLEGNEEFRCVTGAFKDMARCLEACEAPADYAPEGIVVKCMAKFVNALEQCETEGSQMGKCFLESFTNMGMCIADGAPGGLYDLDEFAPGDRCVGNCTKELGENMKHCEGLDPADAAKCFFKNAATWALCCENCANNLTTTTAKPTTTTAKVPEAFSDGPGNRCVGNCTKELDENMKHCEGLDPADAAKCFFKNAAIWGQCCDNCVNNLTTTTAKPTTTTTAKTPEPFTAGPGNRCMGNCTKDFINGVEANCVGLDERDFFKCFAKLGAAWGACLDACVAPTTTVPPKTTTAKIEMSQDGDHIMLQCMGTFANNMENCQMLEDNAEAGKCFFKEFADLTRCMSEGLPQVAEPSRGCVRKCMQDFEAYLPACNGLEPREEMQCVLKGFFTMAMCMETCLAPSDTTTTSKPTTTTPKPY